jgi:hypothetical protein
MPDPRTRNVLRLLVAVVALVGLLGCQVEANGNLHDAAAAPDAATGQDAQVQADAYVPTGDAAIPLVTDKVYAHSASALYAVDPNTLAVSLVGSFGWPVSRPNEQMTDIAIDEAGNMTGVSFYAVFSVDKDTAACTFLSELDYATFNGLSWVEGVGADPQGKTLVGVNRSGSYVTVDPDTGAAAQIGSYGGGLESSGDLVYVRGAGVFATAVSTSHDTDVLVQVNAGSGTATIIGETGFVEIWGLAYWAGQIFGFTNGGQFVTIDPDTGQGTLQEQTSYQFWGAGVTTVAPIVD